MMATLAFHELIHGPWKIHSKFREVPITLVVILLLGIAALLHRKTW